MAEIVWNISGDEQHYTDIAEQIGISVADLYRMGENFANSVVKYDNSSLRNKYLINN